MSYGEKLKEYLHEAGGAHTHAGKVVAFSGLLRTVFGVSGLDIVPNVENYIKSGEVRALKGRMDLHLGQIIIEFKIDLNKELETALEEIERYTAILRERGQRVAACIITDGLKFKVYSVQKKADLVREIDFNQVNPAQAILFLDTFLFNERKIPTAEDLNMRFGPGSAIYEDIVAELATLFKGIKDPIKFELWAKNMELVYGSTPPDEAFVSQTYLMVLVRLLLAKQLVKTQFSIREALNGKLFSNQGIDIIEEDFFSWILNPIFWPQVKALLETLTSAFDIYDLDAVDEDIFKEIYQEIVKRGERHKIGEYYTPEWLAELTIEEAVSAFDPKKERKQYSMLDPACGSGTFLTNAILSLKKNGCSLEEILDNVYGMDLNPLAVAIARTNYLLALGKLIEKRKGAVFIPVFMADSIKLPTIRKELVHGTDILAIDVGEKDQLDLPLNIALDDAELKKVLEVFNDILYAYKAKKLDCSQAIRAFENSYKSSKHINEILSRTLKILTKLIDANRDSVWIFMMRNVYAPLRLKQKRFDIVFGNPPWVSFKFIENPHYKEFIKSAIFEYKLLKPKETSLFTHMDTSTVFYAKTAEVYLSNNGIIAFVMPRSVLTAAKQHEAFKKQEKPPMTLLKILDVENVNPLFNVDACSIIAKKGGTTKYPIKEIVISAELPEKNLRLEKARRYFSIEESEFSPVEKEKVSYYYSRVLEGASIVPRTLWFIKFLTGPFGINPETPSVESLVLPDAKEPWKRVLLTGEVESEFIFATATGQCVLPFKVEFLPIVLPIKKGRTNFALFSSAELRKQGKLKIANWLDAAEIAWKTNGTETSLKNFPTPMDRVNYHNGLVLQKQNLRFLVIYSGSGTHIAAAVVDTRKEFSIRTEATEIKTEGFVADYKTYWLGTNEHDEAYYLAAILNSNILNDKIKQHQSRGKFGPRDICRLPFEQNIPQFDPDNDSHAKLAGLGIKATREASTLPKTSRAKTKAAIPSMKEIDKLVFELLNK